MTNAGTGRTASSETHALYPYVTLTVPGAGIDGQSIVLSSNLGAFQNGQKTWTAVLGDNTDPGKIAPTPQLTSTATGTATVTATVGPTVQTFSIDMRPGLLPIIPPFATVSAGMIAEYESDPQLRFSPDGKMLASAPGYVWDFPSLTARLTPSGMVQVRTLSFSQTGRNIIMGTDQTNPVWYIYDTKTGSITQESPLNTSAYSVVWSDQSDDRRFAIANSASGLKNQLKIYANSTNYYLNVGPTTSDRSLPSIGKEITSRR